MLDFQFWSIIKTGIVQGEYIMDGKNIGKSISNPSARLPDDASAEAKDKTGKSGARDVSVIKPGKGILTTSDGFTPNTERPAHREVRFAEGTHLSPEEYKDFTQSIINAYYGRENVRSLRELLEKLDTDNKKNGDLVYDTIAASVAHQFPDIPEGISKKLGQWLEIQITLRGYTITSDTE